jgi:hydroxymethylpyrimidine pyrophosphatase-like HAD family hydrolase
MCSDVVKGLNNKIKNILASGNHTSEIKKIYDEIKLMGKITNINNET